MSGEQSEEKREILEAPEDEIEERQYVKQVVAEVIRSEEFSGPIPPPQIIKGYEQILPGAADRILTMAEKQSSHRQDMERMIIQSESRDSLLGIWFAFILGIGCIVAAIIITFLVPQNGGAIAGSIIGVTGIGSIIVTFIKSTRGRNGSGNEQSAEKKKEDT